MFPAWFVSVRPEKAFGLPQARYVSAGALRVESVFLGRAALAWHF
jgi:hypothetical protein